MPLQRERLTALLGESTLTSVELVIAPPGYGKTTVLREYAAGDPGAVFIPLPEAADLEAFVRAVIAAAVPAALRSIGAAFDGAGERAVEEHVGTWLVSRLRSFNGTLIIDDFHRTSADPRVGRVLAAAVVATHGRMRWIVASRESPGFPMGSWIARGWMGLPITGEDLSFTLAESTALAATLGIEVGAPDIEAIVNDTLGWPIGVRLALSLVARKRGAGQTRVQTREALFALLDDEVWQPLGGEAQRLLAAAALMPAPRIVTLIASGFGNARDALTNVFARVPFVQPIDDDAFVIHDLFREFVASRATSADAGVDVATRMGTALVAEGSPADGLHLLVAAGRVDDVQKALAVHAFDLLETGHRSAVSAGVALLGERGLNDSGVALAIRGALAYADGSSSNSANLFVRALERNVPASMRGEVARRLALNYANRRMMVEALEVLEPLLAEEAIALEDRLEMQAMSAAFMADAGLRDRAAIDALIVQLERQI